MSSYLSTPSTSLAKAGSLAVMLFGLMPTSGVLADPLPGEPGTQYEHMPKLAPIGVRVDHYLPVPSQDQVPAIDPGKGYRTQKLGRGLYMITDNGYQSMFMVYETGVVVVDAPPGYSAHIRQAIAEVTNLPITHVVYSHAHRDHIGGVNDLGGHPIIIAQDETKRLLKEAKHCG